MNAALERTWTASLGRMRRWRPGHDPTPVYETLGWAVVLSLTGDLGDRPLREVGELKRMGTRALSDADDERDDATDTKRDEDQQYAVTLARAGASALSAALSGREARAELLSARPGRVPQILTGDLVPPSPRRVQRMLRGEVDGFAAASCALHLARRGHGDLVGGGGAGGSARGVR